MLHIILGILKIIGILLLVLFVAVLTILLVVLFVPIRYQASGELYADLLIEAKITWLFRFLSVVVAFREKRLEYSVKLIGIPLIKSDPPDQLTAESKKIRSKKDTSFTEEEDDEDDTEIVIKEEIRSIPSRKKEEPKPIAEKQKVSEEKDDLKVSSTTKIESDADVSEKKPSLIEKMNDLLQRIKSAIESLKEKITNIKHTVENIKKKIDSIVKFIEAESTKNTLAHIKREIIYILYHIRPRELKGNLRLGMDDPGTTGQILGYLSIVQGITGNHLQVEGVFDQKITEGSVFLKGHIRLCHFIKVVLSLLFDRNVRITIKRLLKMRG